VSGTIHSISRGHADEASCETLKGLWTHTKGGFYHDGRFATLPDVINHYNAHFKLDLTEKEVSDLTEYLKSL
jgi:hypothetical protein